AIDADQHGPSEHIAATTVELQAINSAPDVAARDGDRLASLLGRIYDDLNDAARICGNYTAGRPLTTADVIAAHAAATDGLWCSNCETHGHL
ncbi:hypothetical protein, partial [Lactococcus petauri]|uniref:hypothetical protein n=1 Tax=Lactococcus petauri TaxID=1940789 RepID=UPI0021F15188